ESDRLTGCGVDHSIHSLPNLYASGGNREKPGRKRERLPCPSRPGRPVLPEERDGFRPSPKVSGRPSPRNIRPFSSPKQKPPPKGPAGSRGSAPPALEAKAEKKARIPHSAEARSRRKFLPDRAKKKRRPDGGPALFSLLFVCLRQVQLLQLHVLLHKGLIQLLNLILLELILHFLVGQFFAFRHLHHVVPEIGFDRIA